MSLARVIFCWWIALTEAGAAIPIVVLDPKAAVDSRSALIDVAVLRFLPRGSAKDAPIKFAKARTVAELIETMNQLGAGDEMYRASRYLTGWPQLNVAFNSLEHRPAFRYGGSSEPIRYSTFGLNLKVSAKSPPAGDGLALIWNGSYSWSTNFIPKQLWETVLMGAMTAGQVVGAGFTEQDHTESVGLRRDGGQAPGKDLLSIFKRKPKPGVTEGKANEGVPPGATPRVAEPQTYLEALRQERRMTGQSDLQPNQLAVVQINPDSGSGLELFYLAIRYEWQ